MIIYKPDSFFLFYMESDLVSVYSNFYFCIDLTVHIYYIYGKRILEMQEIIKESNSNNFNPV
jgi:hypothetical protein